MGGKRGLGGNGLGSVTVALFGAVLLSGCEGASLPSLPKFQDINPFAEKEVPLPGKRISVIQQENIASDLAAANKPISLPPPRQNDAWSQPGGVANNSPGHLTLGGALKSAWTADAGKGSSFYGKLTASPIVYDGKVFTLDAAGTAAAFKCRRRCGGLADVDDAQGEKDQEGFGGGLAADGGRIMPARASGW